MILFAMLGKILHRSTDSLLNAVAITLIPENEDDVGKWFTRFFANCVAMEPTPPAPHIIRIDDALCLLLLSLSFEADIAGIAGFL